MKTPIPNVLIPHPSPPPLPTVLCYEALHDIELVLTLPLPENPDRTLLEDTVRIVPAMHAAISTDEHALSHGFADGQGEATAEAVHGPLAWNA